MAKSSFSQGNSNCVNVFRLVSHDPNADDLVIVRNTRDNSHDQYLEFTRDEWIALLNGVDLGEFDYSNLEVRDSPAHYEIPA